MNANATPVEVEQAVSYVASIVRGRSSINVPREVAGRVSSLCRRALAEHGMGYGILAPDRYSFEVLANGRRYCFRRWPNGCGTFWGL